MLHAGKTNERGSSTHTQTRRQRAGRCIFRRRVRTAHADMCGHTIVAYGDARKPPPNHPLLHLIAPCSQLQGHPGGRKQHLLAAGSCVSSLSSLQTRGWVIGEASSMARCSRPPRSGLSVTKAEKSLLTVSSTRLRREGAHQGVAVAVVGHVEAPARSSPCSLHVAATLVDVVSVAAKWRSQP